jgi:hypothetical protein
MGWEDGIVAATTQVDKKTSEKIMAWTVTPRAWELYSSVTPPFPKAFGDYADAITAFYNAHPSISTKVTVGQVVDCMSVLPLQSCDKLAKSVQ